MKIAIAKGLGSFDKRWESYCREKNIEFKLVNPYSTNIINEVTDCDAFMWHHHHGECADPLFAKQLLYSLQMAGKKVFPDWHTTWHFDDKVGQKYLLEAVGAPLVPSYVFYNKSKALEWVSQTEFPKVFKLRGGAGASNVVLVKNRKQAEKLISRAFGKGFKHKTTLNSFKERIRMWKEGHQSFMIIVKGIIRMIVPGKTIIPPEKGYVYFQDFVAGNSFDLRVVVIGDKALGEKRLVRKGDFRASGSGQFEYVQLPAEVLKVAFDTAEKLHLQSVAFDFIFCDNKPLIVEMSYAFGTHGISHCPGYYTSDLQWHALAEPDFLSWMVDDMINC